MAVNLSRYAGPPSAGAYTNPRQIRGAMRDDTSSYTGTTPVTSFDGGYTIFVSAAGGPEPGSF